MKPISEKKQAARRKSSKLRDAWKERLEGRCESCGNVCDLEEHHIAGGSHRRENANPRSLMYLCNGCHETIQGMPYKDQFSIACDMTRAAINGEVGRTVIQE